MDGDPVTGAWGRWSCPIPQSYPARISPSPSVAIFAVYFPKIAAEIWLIMKAIHR
jgi:hypothetical protein